MPTLQQIRQANLRKIFEEEGAETPCDICGDPQHDYRNCTKEAYLESQDVRLDQKGGGHHKGSVQTVMFLTWEFALVHGVTNLVILLKIA